MRILSILVGLAVWLASPHAQADSSKRLTILADSFTEDTLAAVRAETRVRGLTLEEMSESWLAPRQVAALAKRADVVAVLYLLPSMSGDSLWAVGREGQRAQAPVPAGAQGRTIAAIAHSLVDELASPVSVHVNVDVKVGVSDTETRSKVVTPAALAHTPNWMMDVGGLLASSEIWAAYGAVLRAISPGLRVGLRGTIAKIPNDGFALAGSAEISRVWGDSLRLELGARGLYTKVWDERNQCERLRSSLIVGPSCGVAQTGLGVGALGAVGYVIGPATFYLRAGADVVTFSNEAPLLAPNGGIGMELAL